MKNIKSDALQILSEVSMEVNGDDVFKAFEDIKLIDDLLGFLRLRSLINHSKGRRTNKEKRLNDIFAARILERCEVS